MCTILEGDRDVYLNKEIRFYASIIYWFMILKLKICHQNSIKVKLRVGWNWGNSVEKIHSETYKANEIRKSVMLQLSWWGTPMSIENHTLWVIDSKWINDCNNPLQYKLVSTGVFTQALSLPCRCLFLLQIAALLSLEVAIKQGR